MPLKIDDQVFVNVYVGWVRVTHISDDPMTFKYTGVDKHGKVFFFDQYDTN